MLRWLGGNNRKRIMAVTVGLLTIAGFFSVSARQASADTLVTAVWNIGGGAQYLSFPCSENATNNIGGSALEVYNPCPYRVWLHYRDSSGTHAFCVNPGGAIAYGFSDLGYSSFTDLQVTAVTGLCYPGNQFDLAWEAAGSVHAYSLPTCNPTGAPFTKTSYWVSQINEDGCNFRMWLHQHDDGTGYALCIDPWTGGEPIPAMDSPIYWQVQETANEAPCIAGPPPYPIG